MYLGMRRVEQHLDIQGIVSNFLIGFQNQTGRPWNGDPIMMSVFNIRDGLKLKELFQYDGSTKGIYGMFPGPMPSKTGFVTNYGCILSLIDPKEFTQEVDVNDPKVKEFIRQQREDMKGLYAEGEPIYFLQPPELLQKYASLGLTDLMIISLLPVEDSYGAFHILAAAAE